MPWIKSMAGKTDSCDVVLGDDTFVSFSHSDIDRTGKGKAKKKWKHKGQDLFYVDYHIYPDGNVSYIISDEPIPEDWWVPLEL